MITGFRVLLGQLQAEGPQVLQLLFPAGVLKRT